MSHDTIETDSHLDTLVNVADVTVYQGEEAGDRRVAPEYRSTTGPSAAIAGGSVVHWDPEGPTAHAPHVALLRSKLPLKTGDASAG